MQLPRIPLNLNIRRKIVVGMTSVMVILGSIGMISYRYLLEIEKKQHFVEAADDLASIILEIRRYEKNVLLYGSQEDMSENEKYRSEAMQLVRSIIPEVREFKGSSFLSRIQQELERYDMLMQQIVANRNQQPQPPIPHIEEQLRETGKTLVDTSQELVRFERQRILVIIRSLKAQLIFSMIVFVMMGAALIPFTAKKIIRPLRLIEETTDRIAKGDFRPAPVPRLRDETQQVIEAFNRMVAELEKRQDQLVQVRKLASLGTMASGIAHQLNNPLNNISTSCQIAIEELEGGDTAFLKRMLGNVTQEVHRARDIVRGLLEFSRVKEFQLLPTPLKSIVERSLRLLSSQIPSSIDIRVDVPETLVLDLDSQRMQQVFLNLVENAVHAIDERPGWIHISAEVDHTENQALIQVVDSGPGIVEEDIGRIFDPFFTTKDVGKGTGLGLSMVYGIVEQHGGTIRAENRPDAGACFTLRLPLPKNDGEGSAS